MSQVVCGSTRLASLSLTHSARFVLLVRNCSGARTPNPVLLAGCVRIYAGEVVIDIIKHAVLGKFNEIRCGGWLGGADV
jgi:hypothetical protein